MKTWEKVQESASRVVWHMAKNSHEFDRRQEGEVFLTECGIQHQYSRAFLSSILSQVQSVGCGLCFG
jgi:hypothetical protein